MKKIWNIFMSAIMVFAAFGVYAVYWEVPIKAATCTTVEECTAKKAELEATKKNLQVKIDAAETETTRQYEAIYAIQEKQDVLTSEISVLNESIIVLQEQEQEMTKEIEDTENVLLGRLKMMQRDEKQYTFFNLLVTSNSLTEVIRRWRWMEMYNKDDAELVDIVTQHRKEVLAMQEQQIADRALIESSKTELSNSGEELKKMLANMINEQAKLETQMSEAQFSAADIDRQKAEAEDYREQLKKEEEANKPAPTPNPENDGGSETPETPVVPDPEPEQPKPTPVQTWSNPTGRSLQRITCPRGCYAGHLGVDFGAWYENIYSIAPGRVLYAGYGYNGGFGNMVVLFHYVNGVDYVSIYAHLSEIGVSEGQTLASGQYIGVSGETGISYGPHLHLELVKGLWYYPSRGEREAYGVDATHYIPGGFN